MQKKISIVTPVFNGEEYIEKCILSIKNQKYENFEHIIMDGGSTDNTVKIAEKYLGTYPLTIVSEKDNGMYDAICKGFARASGEIYAWLNADDVYVPWAFQAMNYAISNGAQWCTGVAAYQKIDDPEKPFVVIPRKFFYKRSWLKKGYYGPVLGYVVQESTFWTKELWEKSNNIIANYKYAGDYWLWREFAKYEDLYTVDSIIGIFSFHTGQLSSNIDKYKAEMGFKPMCKFRRRLIRLKSRFQLFYEKNIKRIK